MDLSVIELQICLVVRKTSVIIVYLSNIGSLYNPDLEALFKGPPLGRLFPTNMALRKSISYICKHAISPSSSRAGAVSHFVCSRHSTPQRRAMATVVPPVTQDETSSKGPTAMVFMNMGGPSTTDEVGDFLSRLFVSRKTLQTSPLWSTVYEIP